MNQLEFQLYLLANMKSEKQIDKTLDKIGFSREALSNAVKKAIAFGLEEVGHPAALYHKILGSPVDIEPVISTNLPDAFKNSIAIRFHLPLWNPFDFVVCENSDGFAWGLHFARAKDAIHPQLSGVVDLKPWAFVSSEIALWFGQSELLEAWSNWEKFLYVIPTSTNGSPQKYALEFTFDLLQCVEIWHS